MDKNNIYESSLKRRAKSGGRNVRKSLRKSYTEFVQASYGEVELESVGSAMQRWNKWADEAKAERKNGRKS